MGTNKGISEDAQIHISVAFLLKAMAAVAIVTGSLYQAQMKFAEQERREQLVEQQKQMEVSFHQIAGAIAVVDQQIAERDEEKSSKTKKDIMKK